MKKTIILLFLVLIASGCNNKKLVCTSTNTDDQGNVSNIKYIFKFNGDVLEAVDKRIETKVKDHSQIDFMYDMYRQTFMIFEDPGIKMDGSHTDDTIKVNIKIDAAKVETINNISGIATMNYDNNQMKKYMESDHYTCE